MQQTASLGLIFIVLGVFLLFTGVIIVFSPREKVENADIRGGAVVFIGPVPIIFGSDRNTALLTAFLSLLLVVAAYFLLKK